MKRILPLAVLLPLALGFIGYYGHSGTNTPAERRRSTPDEEARNAYNRWNDERLKDPATGVVPDDIRRKELGFARHLPARATAKSLTWTQQGPRNRGGRTRAFRVDATDSNTLIAGAATGGIWRSTDAGATWQKTSSPTDLQYVSSIAQDTRAGHTQTWYCGTGESYGPVSGVGFDASLTGNGIFKSTDGGQTWVLLPSTATNDPQVYDLKGAFKHVNAMVVDPARMDSDIVVAALFDGLKRSNDGGATWTTVLGIDTTTTPASPYTEVRVTSTGVYYAALSRSAAYKGFYRSTDGINWTNIGVGNFSASTDRTVIGIDPQYEERVWFFSNTPGNGTFGHSLRLYTYMSSDGSGAGGAWRNSSANLPNGSCTGFLDFDFGHIETQNGYDMCIAVDPTDSGTVFIGGTSVYRSTNGWRTPNSYDWLGGFQCNSAEPSDYEWPNHHNDQHWLEFANGDPDTLYSTNDGGVYRSNDAQADSISWTELNDGFITSQFYTIGIEEGVANSPYIIGGTQDNGSYLATTNDPADPWVNVHGLDGAFCAIPDGRPFMLMSGYLGMLWKKTVADNGTFSAYERIDPVIANPNYNFVNPGVLDPVSQNVLYWPMSNKIYRNSDLAGIPLTNNYDQPLATNWSLVPNGTASGFISALDISNADPNTLLYATTTGRLYRLDSLNQTPVRTILDSPEWPNNAYISCIAPNDFDPAEWLLTFANYGVRSVFHSTDSGATWTSVSGNIEENADGTGSGPAVFWANIYPTWNGAENRYFIGTSTGLYSTALLDGDNTVWEQEGATSIGNVPVTMMVTRNSDGLIAVATHGSGIYTGHLPVAPVGMNEAHASFSIGMVWPVPARDEVRIELNLDTYANMDIKVLDLHGRTVLQRSLGVRPKGTFQWTWDLRGSQGARAAPGAYLVRCTANGQGRTARVIVE